MLAPKRVKFRKRFKGRTSGMATRGNTVAFGHYGLMSLEPGWVSNRQIEAARVALTREMKRGGKVWIRLFPDKPIQEARRNADGKRQGESGRLGGGGEAGTDHVRARGHRGSVGPRRPGARVRQAPRALEVREAGGAVGCRRNGKTGPRGCASSRPTSWPRNWWC